MFGFAGAAIDGGRIAKIDVQVTQTNRRIKAAVRGVVGFDRWNTVPPE
ncbi:hypothetical protein [Fuerstiella marisgermanici]|nr:hypothetical protein [Fuerstiella marisgermanici]